MGRNLQPETIRKFFALDQHRLGGHARLNRNRIALDGETKTNETIGTALPLWNEVLKKRDFFGKSPWMTRGSGQPALKLLANNLAHSKLDGRTSNPLKRFFR